MPQTLLRMGRALVLVALFLAIGGHWALLQTVAWASMIVDYSQAATLTAAVEKTFDGQHPCAICNEIQKGRQSEKKHEAAQSIKKIELFDQRIAEFIYPSANALPEVHAGCFGKARVEAPLAPPPRVA